MSEFTNTVMITFSYKTFCSVDDFQSGLNEAFREGLTAEQWVKDVFAASEWTEDEDFRVDMIRIANKSESAVVYYNDAVDVR